METDFKWDIPDKICEQIRIYVMDKFEYKFDGFCKNRCNSNTNALTRLPLLKENS